MVLKALIFDVDGTLAETEELHRHAFNATFEDYGANRIWPDPARSWNWDQETYRRLLKTTGGKERIATYLRNDLNISPVEWSPKIAQLHGAKTQRYVEAVEAGGLVLRPGIGKLVEDARTAGLQLAIATTTSRANVDALCICCFGKSASELFDVIAAGDEVNKKKPAPDVYLLALERLGLSASEAMAIEDSENGLQSAKAAGLTCIVSPSVYTKCESHDLADIRIDSFSELQLSSLTREAGGTQDVPP